RAFRLTSRCRITTRSERSTLPPVDRSLCGISKAHRACPRCSHLLVGRRIVRFLERLLHALAGPALGWPSYDRHSRRGGRAPGPPGGGRALRLGGGEGPESSSFVGIDSCVVRVLGGG